MLLDRSTLEQERQTNQSNDHCLQISLARVKYSISTMERFRKGNKLMMRTSSNKSANRQSAPNRQELPLL